MITLYYSPQTRATSILSLLRLMGKEAEVNIETVHVLRQGGKGQSDPRNPHPEGKVPLLKVDGQMIRERSAIMLWLTDHFDSPLGRAVGADGRGDYLTWLFYYGNVIEPVLYMNFLELTDNPMVKDWCRDNAAMFAALETALEHHDFLVDDQISAADILVSSPFTWFPDIIPESGPVRDWLARCATAQDAAYIAQVESDGLKALGLPDMA